MKEKTRVILKLSGEALANLKEEKVLNSKKLDDISDIIIKLLNSNFSIGVVIGAGNIFRGRIAEECGIDYRSGDYMGMIGTNINCYALASVLEKKGVKNIVLSTLPIKGVIEEYNKTLAIKYLNEDYVVLFGGGTGNPGFTTDTCAALRAVDINAQFILCGKNGVDGVYDDDPKKNKDAKLIKSLTYQKVLDMNLKVMDTTAIEILKNTDITTKVFSMDNSSNFIDVIKNNNIGTTIKKEF